MIVDFHTHIYPDKIAEATILKLETDANVKAYTNGTLKGLKNSMKDSKVNISVVLPVVTKPKQFESVNKFAYNITEKEIKKEKENIISFGGIHPDTTDYKGELKKIYDLGLKGIKLHPDYQQVFFDDIKYMRIIDYASELGLIISVHAGLDGAFTECTHCTPKRALNVIKEVKPLKLVLAHTGGYAMWNDVEKFIVGEEVYIDTSFSLGHIDNEQFMRIVKNHGTNKVLFATDSPWGNQRDMLDIFMSLDFTKEEKDAILSKNALYLLDIL